MSAGKVAIISAGGSGMGADAAKRLEEMPIALKLIVVVAIRCVQNLDRLLGVRMRGHLRRERLIDCETLAVGCVLPREKA